jgi:hypothetical protein
MVCKYTVPIVILSQLFGLLTPHEGLIRLKVRDLLFLTNLMAPEGI